MQFAFVPFQIFIKILPLPIIMRKGAVQIPNEAFDRTIEYADGIPGIWSLKFKAHALLKFGNLLSHLYPVHHFDSVREFLEYEAQLQSNFDRVAFQEVKVVDKNDRNRTLELTVSDDTGEARLIYPYTLEVVEGHAMLPDNWNNPVHGARNDDKLQVFNSTYKGRGTIILPYAWYLKNDDHYRRMREIRDN